MVPKLYFEGEALGNLLGTHSPIPTYLLTSVFASNLLRKTYTVEYTIILYEFIIYNHTPQYTIPVLQRSKIVHLLLPISFLLFKKKYRSLYLLLMEMGATEYKL